MLDWPQERRHDLLYWSDVATANLHAPNPLVKTEEERYAVLEEMADAFQPLWQARKGDGAGFDLISMLTNNETTAAMSRAEFIGTLFLLIVGGNDTTRNSMSGGLIAMQQYPGEWAKVQDDPSLVPTMVSETIRWQTPSSTCGEPRPLMPNWPENPLKPATKWCSGTSPATVMPMSSRNPTPSG
jgi:cytochrome P450